MVDHITAGADEMHSPKFTNLDADVANWKLLAGKQATEAVIKGGIIERDVRYSLTCRDVEKVANSALLRR